MTGSRFWIVLGTLLAGGAVGCGAFAAHGLDGYFYSKYAGQVFEKKLSRGGTPVVVEEIPLNKKYLADFDTGARYQMYHALALIALGLLPRADAKRLIDFAGTMFLFGIVGFSFGLYAYTTLHLRWVGMSIVPLGGICFLFGWGLFAWAVLFPGKSA